MNQTTYTRKDQTMDVKRIIMDTKIQLIVAEYELALGNTDKAEALLRHIPEFLNYKLPSEDQQPDDKD